LSMAALRSDVALRTGARIWPFLFASWSLTAIPCMPVWHLTFLTANPLLLLS
jgi:hypothetical protein